MIHNVFAVATDRRTWCERDFFETGQRIRNGWKSAASAAHSQVELSDLLRTRTFQICMRK